MNSFSFEDKNPRFTRLKPGLALRLLSKGLLYIRAMLSYFFILTLNIFEDEIYLETAFSNAPAQFEYNNLKAIN